MQQNPSPQPDDVGKPRTRSKRKRMFRIEYRYPKWDQRTGEYAEGKMSEWEVWGKYHTEAARDQALDNLHRKFDHSDWRMRWEFRTEPEKAP